MDLFHDSCHDIVHMYLSIRSSASSATSTPASAPTRKPKINKYIFTYCGATIMMITYVDDQAAAGGVMSTANVHS